MNKISVQDRWPRETYSSASRAATFNDVFPVGSRVWLKTDGGATVATRTISAAFVDDDGGPLVKVEGLDDPVALDRVGLRV